MSLKVLLADDSMTAQNMGRKILAESGYDVTTVSNGAAAVKKIAEVKPDLVILDIYMSRRKSTTPFAITVFTRRPTQSIASSGASSATGIWN